MLSDGMPETQAHLAKVTKTLIRPCKWLFLKTERKVKYSEWRFPTTNAGLKLMRTRSPCLWDEGAWVSANSKSKHTAHQQWSSHGLTGQLPSSFWITRVCVNTVATGMAQCWELKQPLYLKSQWGLGYDWRDPNSTENQHMRNWNLCHHEFQKAFSRGSTTTSPFLSLSKSEPFSLKTNCYLKIAILLCQLL